MRYSLLIASVAALQPVALAFPKAPFAQGAASSAPAAVNATANRAAPGYTGPDAGSKAQVKAKDVGAPASLNTTLPVAKVKDAGVPASLNTTAPVVKAKDAGLPASANATGPVAKVKDVGSPLPLNANKTAIPATVKAAADGALGRNGTVAIAAADGNETAPVEPFQVKQDKKPADCVEDVKSTLKTGGVAPEIADEVTKGLSDKMPATMTEMTLSVALDIVAGATQALGKTGDQRTDIPTVQICVSAVINSIMVPNEATEILISMTVGMIASGEDEKTVRSGCEEYTGAVKAAVGAPQPVGPSGAPTPPGRLPSPPAAKPGSPSAGPSAAPKAVQATPAGTQNLQNLLQNPAIKEASAKRCTKPAFQGLVQSMNQRIIMKLDIRISMVFLTGVRDISEATKLGQQSTQMAINFFQDCSKQATQSTGIQAEAGLQIVSSVLADKKSEEIKASVPKIEEDCQKVTEKADKVPPTPVAAAPKPVAAPEVATSARENSAGPAPAAAPADRKNEGYGPAPVPAPASGPAPAPAPASGPSYPVTNKAQGGPIPVESC